MSGRGKIMVWVENGKMRRGDREAEGARLLSVCTPKVYRGFESLPLRHFLRHFCCPCGEVAEWFMALVLKTSDSSRGPGVRIPPSPPFSNCFAFLFRESTLCFL